jgi:2-polyprenyl-6-methoxyphenol hydroxylase-like FAD-dependent oxidoreductase
MVRGDVASSLPEVFESHAALSQRSQSWRQLTSLVTTSPLLFRTPEPVKNGMLQAGDSAGFVDPFVGDGISLALRSGALAAESLRNFVGGRESLEDAMRGYSESYKRDLLPVFRTSSGIRRLFQVPEPFRTGILGLFHVVPMLTRYLVRKTR